MLPLRDDNPSNRVPVVTYALIAANVAAYLFELAQGPSLRAFLMDWGVVPYRLVAALSGDGAWTAQLTTVFTSLFLHAGWPHLIGNMWYLWVFGDNVEDRMGHAGFLAFYLAAGACAALVHSAVLADSIVPTVGASGAIAGVLGAYAFAFPRAKVLTLIPLIVFFQVVSLPALLLLGLWFVFQFTAGALFSSGNGGVAWWAHIAGFVFGFVVMSLFTRSGADHTRERTTSLP